MENRRSEIERGEEVESAPTEMNLLFLTANYSQFHFVDSFRVFSLFDECPRTQFDLLRSLFIVPTVEFTYQE